MRTAVPPSVVRRFFSTWDLAAVSAGRDGSRCGRVTVRKFGSGGLRVFIRCPVLVGRQEQVERFSALARTAAQGRGSAVFVSAEPGVGKSRLVQEFVTTARAAGLLDVTGRAVATGTPVPLRAFVELALSVSRRGLLPDPAVLGPCAASLERLLPGWTPDRRLHDEASSAPVLGEALHALIRAIAPDGCLVVLEDLHWADPESLAVVEYLCDTVEDSPLVLVATLRSGEGAAAWTVADALVARRRAEFMPLGPLEGDEVEAMARACGAAGSTARLDRAEGVPLFIEELLVSSDVDGIPRTVVESVRRRVSGLDHRSRRVLTAAALCGRHFDWRLVGESLALDGREVDSALRAGVGCGLLDTDRAGYRFHHALFRDAVLAEATRPEEAELAALLGLGLDRRHPDLPAESCVMAADLAVLAGDRGRAAAMLLRAARLAGRAALLTSAATQARRGLELADTQAARVALGELLADSLCRAGRLDEAVVSTRRLLDDARGCAQERAVVASAHLRLARAAATAHRWDLAEAELAGVGTPDEPVSTVHTELVRSMIMLGRHAARDAGRRAQALVDPALALGRADLACAALEVVGRAARPHDTDSAAAAFGRAHTIAVDRGLELAGLSALHELGTIDMFTTGRLDRLLEARRRAVEAGAAMLVATLDLQLVPAHYMRGEADAARAAALRAIDEATSLGLEVVRARVRTFLPHTAGLRGDRAAVERDVAAIPSADLAVDPDAEAGVWGTARGICSLLLEDRDAARAELETAARVVRAATDTAPHLWWGFWALLRAVEGRDARTAITALRSCPAVVNGQNAVLADLAEAVLLGRAGVPGRAAEIVESLGPGASPWAWQQHLARRLVAEAALRQGWGRPVAWLDEAAVFFDGFRAPAVARACRALADRSRPASLRPTPHCPPVTPREREVLVLLRDGSSNREIARVLSISPRTVEKHVEAVGQKLGARGRGPLIALAGTLDLPPTGRTPDGERSA